MGEQARQNTGRIKSERSLPTIQDVARRAGVSTATVSYTFSRPGRVSPDLRARVKEAARALDYRPNRTARTLRTQRSDLISLIVPDVANHFYAALARGVQDAVRSRGLHVILASTDAVAEEEQEFLWAARDQRAGGVIVVPFRLDGAAVRQACGPQMPVVLIGHDVGAGNLPVVTPDDEGGAQRAVDHLLRTGRRRIAYIGGMPFVEATDRRWRGLVRAYQAFALEPDPNLRVFADFQRAGGETAMTHLLDRGLPLDAVFAANDLMAIGALRTLRGCGIRVPDDVAVMGFDDIDEAEIVDPPLTTVVQPAYKLGNIAAKALLDTIDGEPVPLRQTVPCELMLRDSA